MCGIPWELLEVFPDFWSSAVYLCRERVCVCLSEERPRYFFCNILTYWELILWEMTHVYLNLNFSLTRQKQSMSITKLALIPSHTPLIPAVLQWFPSFPQWVLLGGGWGGQGIAKSSCFCLVGSRVVHVSLAKYWLGMESNCIVKPCLNGQEHAFYNIIYTTRSKTWPVW